jgi:hypothetical protein
MQSQRAPNAEGLQRACDPNPQRFMRNGGAAVSKRHGLLCQLGMRLVGGCLPIRVTRPIFELRQGLL